MLFAIGVAAHYSRRQHDQGAMLAALEEIEATAADARRELRETLQRLSEHEEGIGFEARLEGEVRLFERTSGWRLRVVREGEPRELPEPVEDLLLDALIEGLRNAAKHARAKFMVAHLSYRAGHVTLALHAEFTPQPVRDVDSWRGEGTGAGLALLEQRTTQLRGTLELQTDVSGRRILRLQVPTIPVRRQP
jgi:signal transduction histidine kinase